MIKSITSPSLWLSVNHYQNTPHISPGSQGAGMVRYNTSYNRLEVYDGLTWLELGGGATVDLNPNAREVLEWGRKKMDEELKWQEMARRSAAVKDAYEKFKQAEEQLKIVEALVKEDNVAG